MSLSVGDCMALVASVAPLDLAESWDASGLQVGDRRQPVRRIGVALDATFGTVSEAVEKDVDFLVVHHPLFFRPLKNLVLDTPLGRVIDTAIRNGLSIYAAHTNLDSVAGGLNDALASHIGLGDIHVLGQGIRGSDCVLHLKVPVFLQPRVHEVLAGGGRDISWWDGMKDEGGSCIARCRIRGNKVSGVQAKIRSLCPDAQMDAVPAGERETGAGLGRMGFLSASMTLSAFSEKVKKDLGLEYVRMVGNPETPVRCVALCTGSGGGMMHDALARGADVLLTGDLKYHEAMDALDHGLCLVDAGHFGTERIMVDLMLERLRSVLGEKGEKISLVPLASQKDPFSVL
ncbi:dinuclear metal center YbgI/SA1388 family protein [Desulfobotulus alkaliphilus]|uniref:GTP cyclohydrolase 1 type 2 homolog n=1 Tax=Desulfobotulus alkaliphilus TaxID=622671 RepID=A0A562RIM7_9BACT|nr:Nif3-like dinuclear metal center hexameric protein [Desulfobotulus alkaliphilus]TWI68937.1 dinuclear metal center YbgI/SA1388 family protein [Desulfobotulus alkaliphilus]